MLEMTAGVSRGDILRIIKCWYDRIYAIWLSDGIFNALFQSTVLIIGKIKSRKINAEIKHFR
jgi:hypothetical protein